MNKQTAVLAGGCFWGLEDLIRKQPGVIDTEVGDSSGAESVQITYDADKTSFKQLLDFYFRVHDPTTQNRQGNDVGPMYRSTIFYQNEEEKRIAQEMIDIVNADGRWENPVVTTLEPFKVFKTADEFHQDFLRKNPGGYTCHFERGGSYLQ